MSNRLELAGQRFGKWTVLMDDGKNPSGNIMWLCLCDCGNQGRVPGSLLKSGRSTSCGRWCSTETTERYIDSDGYAWAYVKDHPRARLRHGKWRSRQVREHILVMEQTLGRYLLPGENVHHKNGVRHDNRPENLELWVSFQPSGQRPEDLVAWAKEILERYGKE